jgi:hypothetical protein
MMQRRRGWKMHTYAGAELTCQGPLASARWSSSSPRVRPEEGGPRATAMGCWPRGASESAPWALPSRDSRSRGWTGGQAGENTASAEPSVRICGITGHIRPVIPQFRSQGAVSAVFLPRRCPVSTTGHARRDHRMAFRAARTPWAAASLRERVRHVPLRASASTTNATGWPCCPGTATRDPRPIRP